MTHRAAPRHRRLLLASLVLVASISTAVAAQPAVSASGSGRADAGGDAQVSPAVGARAAVAAPGVAEPFAQTVLRGANPGEQFGSSVAVSPDGSAVAVATRATGSVQVWVWRDGAWVRRGAPLTGSDWPSANWDLLDRARPIALAPYGEAIAIGEPYPGSAVSVPVTSGRVRVYTWDSDAAAWTQFGEDIYPYGGLDYSQGFSLALPASAFLITGGIEDSLASAGSVHAYQYTPANGWTPIAAEPLRGPRGFGYRVAAALSGQGWRLVVGSPLESAVYLYSLMGGSTTGWYEDRVLPGPGGEFGTSVAISENGAVIAAGAPSFGPYGWVHVESADGSEPRPGVRGPYAMFSGTDVSLTTDGSELLAGSWGDYADTTVRRTWSLGAWSAPEVTDWSSPELALATGPSVMAASASGRVVVLGNPDAAPTGAVVIRGTPPPPVQRSLRISVRYEGSGQTLTPASRAMITGLAARIPARAFGVTTSCRASSTARPRLVARGRAAHACNRIAALGVPGSRSVGLETRTTRMREVTVRMSYYLYDWTAPILQ